MALVALNAQRALMFFGHGVCQTNGYSARLAGEEGDRKTWQVANGKRHYTFSGGAALWLTWRTHSTALLRIIKAVAELF